MPIESIQTPKAPADWRLDPDQAAQVARDPRLKRLSRDELFAFFNRPASTPTKQPPKRGASTPAPSRGLGAIFNRVTQAMGGK